MVVKYTQMWLITIIGRTFSSIFPKKRAHFFRKLILVPPNSFLIFVFVIFLFVVFFFLQTQCLLSYLLVLLLPLNFFAHLIYVFFFAPSFHVCEFWAAKSWNKIKRISRWVKGQEEGSERESGEAGVCVFVCGSADKSERKRSYKKFATKENLQKRRIRIRERATLFSFACHLVCVCVCLLRCVAISLLATCCAQHLFAKNSRSLFHSLSFGETLTNAARICMCACECVVSWLPIFYFPFSQIFFYFVCLCLERSAGVAADVAAVVVVVAPPQSPVGPFIRLCRLLLVAWCVSAKSDEKSQKSREKSAEIQTKNKLWNIFQINYENRYNIKLKPIFFLLCPKLIKNLLWILF